MAGCTGTTLGIKWLSKTGPTVKWLKQLRPIVFDASPRLPRCTSSLMTANLEQSQRNISTTTPCFVKESKHLLLQANKYIFNRATEIGFVEMPNFCW